MLIEAARRAEAAVKEMLAVANEGSATTGELRNALGISSSIAGVNSAFQVSAAASVAGRERHGDGGAEVLASGAGLSRQEARSQIKTAEVLRGAPRLRDAVESGRVSAANARRLGEAASKTSAADVDGDAELLAKAESMRPEQFTKETRRWAVERHGDGGESEHARQRGRRCVRMWNGDDGMVQLRGEFDAVTGERIRNRLRVEAGRLLDTDKKHASANGSGHPRRSFDQCMADALEHLTSSSVGGQAAKPFADICVVAHVDEDTGKLVAELPDGARLPQSVLEELACNAKFTGIVYDRKGRPIWRAQSVRRATDAQRQLLIARDGGCFACGAHPDICDAHHVKPVSEGGATSIDNMVLACWSCHHKVHYFGWQVCGPPGSRTLHPPDTVIYGPARAAEPASLFCPESTAPPEQARLLEPVAAQSPNMLVLRIPQLTRAPDHPPANRPRQRGARPAQHCNPRPNRPRQTDTLLALHSIPRPNRPRQTDTRPAQHSHPPARPGPATARAVLARSHTQRAGTPDALADDRGPPSARPGPAAARATLRAALQLSVQPVRGRGGSAGRRLRRRRAGRLSRSIRRRSGPSPT